MKREELKSLVDIPKLPPASGNRMLQDSSIRLRKEVSTLLHFIGKVDGENARPCAKKKKPRNDEVSSPFASIDACQQIGPVLNVGIVKIVDVYSIEVSNPMFSTCVLISGGQERFVNEPHLHNNTIVNQSFSLQGKNNSKSVDQVSNEAASANPMQGLQESDTCEQHISHVTFCRTCMRTCLCLIDNGSSLACAAHISQHTVNVTSTLA